MMGIQEKLMGQMTTALREIEPVRLAYVIGSFLRSDSFRDVDLAVLLQDQERSPDYLFQRAMQIGLSVERALQPRYPCDVRILNHAPIEFQYQAIKSGQCIWTRSDDERILYEAEAISTYLDYQESIHWFDQRLLARVVGEKMDERRRVLDLLRELAEALQDWERYLASVSLEDMRQDRDRRNMVLHALLVAIQSAIDIANHLVAEHTLRRPSTYRESFEILSESGILSADLAQRLATLAGFRNVLVHIYWRLDLEQAHGVLLREMDTLQAFAQAVTRQLETS